MTMKIYFKEAKTKIYQNSKIGWNAPNALFQIGREPSLDNLRMTLAIPNEEIEALKARIEELEQKQKKLKEIKQIKQNLDKLPITRGEVNIAGKND